MQLLLEALTYHRGSDEPLSVVVILIVRVTLVVATGCLAARAFARASAAVQHRVWLFTVLGTLVVPVVWALTPSWRVPLVAVHVQGVRPVGLAVAPAAGHSGWPELLVAVWIVGALVGLGYTLLGIVLARRLFRASQPCHDRGWLDALAAAQAEICPRRRVELRIARSSMSPAVWGFRRVQMLLPSESRDWPPAQKRSVLVHELAHVARRDCLSQLLANLACAAWWFHPLVWFAAGRVRALGEQAADDCVIRAGQARADYAEQLLSIAGALGWARLPRAVQTMFHPSHLERRLRAILDPARRRNDLAGGRSLASIVIACALVIPLATLTPSVVRGVAHPPPDNAYPAVEVKRQLRIRVPATPAHLPGYRRLQVDPRDGSLLVPTQSPAVPPPVTFELIPNWEVGRRAEMLIPNHVPGTEQVLLVDPVGAPQVVSVSMVTSTADAAPAAAPLSVTQPAAAP